MCVWEYQHLKIYLMKVLPLLKLLIYLALWHWSVKPSVKRKDAH